MTKDGRTCVDRTACQDGTLWNGGNRRVLKEIPEAGIPLPYHSLLAETGPRAQGYAIERFREFVVFNGALVYPEYLLAYKRKNADSM